jgi:hypothetical protein
LGLLDLLFTFPEEQKLRTTILAFLLAGLVTFAAPQKKPAKKAADSGQTAADQQTKTAPAGDGQADKNDDEEGPWKGLQYRLVGPFRGGRVVAVAGVVGKDNENVYYFGSTAGGVWKTTDGGLNWRPIFDKQKDASPAIGAIAVSESDPNVIYVGPGEACIRGTIVGGSSLALPILMPSGGWR